MLCESESKWDAAGRSGFKVLHGAAKSFGIGRTGSKGGTCTAPRRIEMCVIITLSVYRFL